MYYECETEIVRCDIRPMPILMVTEDRIDCANGKIIRIKGKDYVIVAHANYSTFSPTAFQKSVYVVPAIWYEKEENPEDDDDAIIGYYYYSTENDMRNSSNGKHPSDYYLRVHENKHPVKRKPYVRDDDFFKANRL